MTRAKRVAAAAVSPGEAHILDNIGSGKWSTSARVPSENDIVKPFGVSRMTANRALRELRDEGVLVRIAGVGSFVADQHAHAHPLEIRSIADEIRRRGPCAPRRDRFPGASRAVGRSRARFRNPGAQRIVLLRHRALRERPSHPARRSLRSAEARARLSEGGFQSNHFRTTTWSKSLPCRKPNTCCGP